MDNYQLLFNETRPNSKKTMSLPSTENLDKFVHSNWVKNLHKGVNLYKQSNYVEAITYLDKSIHENPNNQFLFKVRANIKEENNDPNGAILDYKKALYISGSDWYSIYNQIAINFLNKKDFQNALNAFDISINLKNKLKEDNIDENLLPYIIDGVVNRIDYEKMYTNRANVKLSLKDYQGCADDCATAIEINPDYSNSYFIYGLLFLTVDQNENAYKILKLAESKGHKQATNLLKQYF